MLIEEDLVFSMPEGDQEEYLKAVQETEKTFLDILKGESDPATAAYTTYIKLAKTNAPLLEIEGMAQLLKKLEALPKSEQNEFIAKEPLYYDGQLVSIGTLFLDAESYGTEEVLRYYKQSKISIENTIRGKEIQFIAVTINGKQLLVSSRNVLCHISWKDLDNQGLITGVPSVIDGKRFLLRVLTGGSDEWDQNEWDKMLSIIEVNNGSWNWPSSTCWCQEKLTTDTCRARGGAVGEYHYSINRNVTGKNITWRPVLELM